MFGHRLAYQYQTRGDENWAPPWLRNEGAGLHARFFRGHHGFGPFTRFRREWERGGILPWEREDWRGPRFFEMRRGHGPFGFGGEGRRFFGRGDMKFALLNLLQERPMHGYEMMKALEERSGGFYTPSPGSIYPTLQMLEDGGFVTVQEVEGKKVYSITDAGRALLTERQQEAESFAGPPWMRKQGRGGQWHRPEIQALRSEMADAARLLSIAARMSFADPEQMARLRAIVERTRKELADMIYGAGNEQGESSTASSRQEENPTVDQA